MDVGMFYYAKRWTLHPFAARRAPSSALTFSLLTFSALFCVIYAPMEISGGSEGFVKRLKERLTSRKTPDGPSGNEQRDVIMKEYWGRKRSGNPIPPEELDIRTREVKPNKSDIRQERLDGKYYRRLGISPRKG